MNRSFKSCTLRLLLFLAWFRIATCVTYPPVDYKVTQGTQGMAVDAKLLFKWTDDELQFRYTGKSSLMTCELSILDTNAGTYEYLLTASKDSHSKKMHTIDVQDKHLNFAADLTQYVKLRLRWTDHTQLPASASRST